MSSDLSEYFHTKKWAGGGAETVSGKGSTLAFTAQLRPALEAILRRLSAKVFLDAPCGDFNWMSKVNLQDIKYIGVDIIDSLVAENQRRYGGPDREFCAADISSDPLPKADLMLCRDCTFHLPIAFVWRILENFGRSGIPYLLTTQINNNGNADMPKPGGYQSRNFLLDPFLLSRPKPENWLVDDPRGKGNRYLCLWSSHEIRDAIERAKQDGRFVPDRLQI
jgi:hypothetical protein